MLGLAITVLGLCLTVLGIILAYIWKGNNKFEKALLEGQKEIVQMLLTQTKILERIEGKIPSPV